MPGADGGYAIAYLYEVDDEGAYTFNPRPPTSAGPGLMAEEPVAYTDDEIDERYRDEDDAEEGAEVAEAADPSPRLLKRLWPWLMRRMLRNSLTRGSA